MIIKQIVAWCKTKNQKITQSISLDSIISPDAQFKDHKMFIF